MPNLVKLIAFLIFCGVIGWWIYRRQAMRRAFRKDFGPIAKIPGIDNPMVDDRPPRR